MATTPFVPKRGLALSAWLLATVVACGPDRRSEPPPLAPAAAAESAAKTPSNGPATDAVATGAPAAAHEDGGALDARRDAGAADAAADGGADSGGLDSSEPERDPRQPEKLSESSGSTAARSRDGLLHVAGRDRRARHTHGGAPARIGDVVFVVTNDSDRARRITAVRADFMRDHGCEAPASTVVSHPKLGSVALDQDDDDRPDSLSLTVAPRTSQGVRVSFAVVDAYYAWCDRFAIRVRFSVDGRESLSAISELAVMRVEPIR